MKLRHIFAVAVVVLGAAAGPARADQVTLPASLDNTLFQSTTGSLSNALGPELFAGRTVQGANDLRRALIAFDVAAAIPSGSTITGVQLRLFMSKTISGSQATTLHRVTESWGEGTSNAGVNGGDGAAATVGDATWVHRFFNATTWSTPGGSFAAAASASQGVAGNNFYTWGSTVEMVADVQFWLDTPASNFGWLVKGNEASAGSAKRFDSSEHPTTANRPALIVDFTPPDVPTESATWGRVKALFD